MIVNKNVILFDLDGTLTDPKVGITKSVAYALAQDGIEVSDLNDLCTFIGPPLKISFMQEYGYDEDKAQDAIQQYRVYFERKGMLENEVYPGIEEILKELREQGKLMLVATSKPWVYAKQILQHFHLDSYFLDICGSELDGTRSRKDEVIAHALASHGLKAKDCVMVGDRMHDIAGAKANRMRAVGVLYGYGSLSELGDAGADYIAKDIEALKNILL